METSCVEPFADGDYLFFLPMPRIIAAEREADASIFEVFHSLGESLAEIGDTIVLAGTTGTTLKQCHAVIRNALIGGDTSETEARDLVATYCYPTRPAISDMALAWKILRAAVYGVESKKNSEAEEPSPSASTEAGSSATAASSGSTGKPQASATISKRSKRTGTKTRAARGRSQTTTSGS